jgi:hypothetical protein
MDFAVSAWLSRSNDWLAFGWPVGKIAGSPSNG